MIIFYYWGGIWIRYSWKLNKMKLISKIKIREINEMKIPRSWPEYYWFGYWDGIWQLATYVSHRSQGKSQLQFEDPFLSSLCIPLILFHFLHPWPPHHWVIKEKMKMILKSSSQTYIYCSWEKGLRSRKEVGRWLQVEVDKW